MKALTKAGLIASGILVLGFYGLVKIGESLPDVPLELSAQIG